MTTQSIAQGPIPGAFIARALSRSRSYDRGVLHPDAASLGDGVLVREEAGLLLPWAADSELAGILVQPERAEIESGRRRVVIFARQGTVHFDRLIYPPGEEVAAKAALDSRTILWRPEDLPGG